MDRWFAQGEKMRTLQYRRGIRYGRNQEAMLGAMKSSLDEFAPQVLEIKIVLAGHRSRVELRLPEFSPIAHEQVR